MRADARANRDALLAAARRLYATKGADIPFTQVAAEAGVGVGTLYRHFPTSEDLQLGVVADIRDRVLDICARWLPGMEEEPERAWRGFVDDVVALDLGAYMPQMIGSRHVDELPGEALAMRATVLAQVEAVLGRAKAAGLIRDDVTPLHFQAGIGAFTRPLPVVLTSALPDLRDWLTEIYLAGLRPVAGGAD